jgi:protein Mpv17
MNAVRALARRYNHYNGKMPILVQAMTAGGIASAGDLICQTTEGRRLRWWPAGAGASDGDEAEGEQGYDWMRVGRLAAFRLFLFGPYYSMWLRTLHRYVVLPKKWQTVSAQIMLDQFIMAPPALSSFFMFMSMAEGNSIDDSVSRTRQTLWPTVQVNWCFWIPVQAVTFGIVPKGLQVGFVSLVQVGWNAWLSGVNNTARIAATKESARLKADKEEEQQQTKTAKFDGKK